MTTNILEYICPIVILFMIFVLKLGIDEEICLEHFKRLMIEISVDIMSLATSFILSFLITSGSIAINNNTQSTYNNLIKGITFLLLYIALLIITIICCKYSIRMYIKTEKMRYIFIGGIIGLIISISSLCYSIKLLCTIGGIKL